MLSVIPDVPMRCEPHGLSPDDCPSCVEFAPVDERRGEPCRVCPTYVIKCAHLDGDPRVVCLIDTDAFASAPNPCNHPHIAPVTGWDVYLGVPVMKQDCIYPYWPEAAWISFFTRTEADAAFERFEQLRRDTPWEAE